MQYILTEEEYQDLKKKHILQLDIQKNKLQKLCTKIANTMPVFYWGNKEASIWGCIHNEQIEREDYLGEDEGAKGVEIQLTPGYCDECPVTDICPSSKRWSK
ncbi:hypothetical protein 65p198 [Aeromonas phage 65]|uniref:Uncharacterized protein n=1 Tax=Aeromonas phage 65 TaxID=2919549 RepID=E5DS32_9CAUD|nr:hypothetical protein ST65p198 [Aeromonas phage 65]ADQ53206.1 hypothetical protein 65p198 [Aeromonas phage 65]